MHYQLQHDDVWGTKNKASGAILFKTISLLKCYHAKPEFAKKTHTVSVCEHNWLYETYRRRYSPCEELHRTQDIDHHPFGSSIST